VGYVPQDAFLFHDSIRRNLIWARPGATEDEVVGALRQASAEFVLRLPDGLDTVVGDRGVLLSAGQRQRVALARALLRQPALLVLDEATSALDSENERAIQAATRSLHGRVTVLVIAHRLSTVREADRIHVLEAGRVVEAGTWSELVSRSEGRFRALCEAQGVTVGR
jgi:ABC-type multidrug transport system fused ATPase/permease subunit